MARAFIDCQQITNPTTRAEILVYETVQKIAYLLGENAAETEELLNSIIQSYRYEDDK